MCIGMFFCIAAEERSSLPIKISIKGGGDNVLCADTMNSLKDVVCKLILYIPVIMVTLGDKGLLVCANLNVFRVMPKKKTEFKKSWVEIYCYCLISFVNCLDGFEATG